MSWLQPWSAPSWNQCNRIMAGAAIGGALGQGLGALAAAALYDAPPDLPFDYDETIALAAYTGLSVLGAGVGAVVAAAHYREPSLVAASGLGAALGHMAGLGAGLRLPAPYGYPVPYGVAGGTAGAALGSYLHGAPRRAPALIS